MHEPVHLEVIWDDADIEIRLMKALAEITDTAVKGLSEPKLDPLAMKRVGDWYARRCSDRVVSIDE